LITFAKTFQLKRLSRLTCFLLLLSYFVSCTTIDLYEKSTTIPGHEWRSDFKPSFNFEIKDAVFPYKIFLVLRHTEKYNFNNIYVRLTIRMPGNDSDKVIQRDVRLATNEGGWEGSGMDDVYEHRSLLSQGEILKAGTYTFTIEQIMREDPLKNVLNVGLRLEKETR
jgi:gliding motility-associated lipoprotein GldH